MIHSHTFPHWVMYSRFINESFTHVSLESLLMRGRRLIPDTHAQPARHAGALVVYPHTLSLFLSLSHTHFYPPAHTHIHHTLIHMCTHMLCRGARSTYTHTHIHTHTRTHTHTHTHAHTRTHIHTHRSCQRTRSTHTQTHIHTFSYTNTLPPTRIHTHTHKHTHTHTHTQTHSLTHWYTNTHTHTRAHQYWFAPWIPRSGPKPVNLNPWTFRQMQTHATQRNVMYTNQSRPPPSLTNRWGRCTKWQKETH